MKRMNMMAAGIVSALLCGLSVPAEAGVEAAWARDVRLGIHDRARVGKGDGMAGVVLYGRDGVRDVRILSISFKEEKGGNLVFTGRTVYSQRVLVEGRPLVVDIDLIGSIPNNAVSFVDGDGTRRTLAIGESGEDGSVTLTPVVVEMEPVAGSFLAQSKGVWRLDGVEGTASYEFDGKGGWTSYYASGAEEASGTMEKKQSFDVQAVLSRDGKAYATIVFSTPDQFFDGQGRRFVRTQR